MAAGHLGRVRVLGLLIIIAGVVLVIAGGVTWFAVRAQLADENITVSQDASMFAGDEVDGPFSAYAEANTEQAHTRDAEQRCASVFRVVHPRQTAMTGSFLRASLFTSVVAFGVAAMAAGIGVLMILIGWALRSVAALPTAGTSPPAM